MNNNYYKIVKLIQDCLDKNPIVNTILYARTEDKDLYKNNIYPLVHINPTMSSWNNYQSNIFSFEVGVLNQRIKDNRNDDKKLTGDNNIIDNHATCYAILNDFIQQLEVGIEDNDLIYNLESVSSIEPIFYSGMNGLDGWAFTIELKVNNDLELC